MNQFISTTEAAKILGISRIALFYKIKSGQIKAMKVGRNYIIDRKEIMKIPEKGELSAEKKAEIDKEVARVVREYGETLKLLKDS